MRHSTRRRFFGTIGAATLGFSTRHLVAGERPPVTNPRATDGDKRYEPDWDERLTVTVGQKAGDLVGDDGKVLQKPVPSR